MRTISDTWVMTRRSMLHIVRSLDTIITVVLMPIAMMLMFVYVFGGAIGTQTGGIGYVDFIVPGIVAMTVVSGIGYAAVRLSMDLQKGVISRFRTMPIAPISILGGQALSSTLSTLVSSLLVVAVAFVMGFRTTAGPLQWLEWLGIVLLFTFATTWLAMFFGLLARTTEGAGAFTYILMLLIFLSTAFVPAKSIAPGLLGFARAQPMTPIVETLRSLLTVGSAGPSAGVAVIWCASLLAASVVLALVTYRHRPIAPAA